MFLQSSSRHLPDLWKPSRPRFPRNVPRRCHDPHNVYSPSAADRPAQNSQLDGFGDRNPSVLYRAASLDVPFNAPSTRVGLSGPPQVSTLVPEMARPQRLTEGPGGLQAPNRTATKKLLDVAAEAEAQIMAKLEEVKQLRARVQSMFLDSKRSPAAGLTNKPVGVGTNGVGQQSMSAGAPVRTAANFKPPRKASSVDCSSLSQPNPVESFRPSRHSGPRDSTVAPALRSIAARSPSTPTLFKSALTNHSYRASSASSQGNEHPPKRLSRSPLSQQQGGEHQADANNPNNRTALPPRAAIFNVQAADVIEAPNGAAIKFGMIGPLGSALGSHSKHGLVSPLQTKRSSFQLPFRALAVPEDAVFQSSSGHGQGTDQGQEPCPLPGKGGGGGRHMQSSSENGAKPSSKGVAGGAPALRKGLLSFRKHHAGLSLAQHPIDVDGCAATSFSGPARARILGRMASWLNGALGRGKAKVSQSQVDF